jgi:predicted GNAT superfamily acetyltransferase
VLFRSRRYYPDFYGPSSSPLQGGLPTDRLYAEWWLRSPRVLRVLGETAGQGSAPKDDASRITEDVMVPHQIHDWKQSSATRDRAEEVQRNNREALQSAFKRGLAVIGYRRADNGDGHFLLGPLEPVEIAPGGISGKH